MPEEKKPIGAVLGEELMKEMEGWSIREIALLMKRLDEQAAEKASESENRDDAYASIRLIQVAALEATSTFMRERLPSDLLPLLDEYVEHYLKILRRSAPIQKPGAKGAQS